MRLVTLLVTFAALLLGLASARPSLTPILGRASQEKVSSPTIKLKQGKVQGYTDDNYGLDVFLGVPYAKAPVGKLRFAKPVPIDASNDVIDATKFGDVCMQVNNTRGIDVTMSEDCLHIDVIRPQGVKAGAKLPVLTWIYGGAFQVGATDFYNASQLVQRSVDAGKPIVFAAISYRVGAFGFLGGSELAKSKSATPNAGLYDQRLGFKWIRDNIAKFGGDPKRVTIFGQSAGAMSVALQTFAYDGNTHNLFHAAIMQSGGVAPGPLLTPTHPTVEKTYVDLAAGVGCNSSANGTKLLSCLRQAEASALLTVSAALTTKAAGTFPIPGLQAFLPLVDGDLITDYPHVNFAKGKLADIPVITGNALDEGPQFVSHYLNNTSDFETWLRSGAVIYNTSYTETAIQKVLELYPDTPAEGSPYENAGTATSAATAANDSRVYEPLETNQYKRAASFFGDFVFGAHRRAYLSGATKAGRKNRNKTWSYIFSQNDKYPNGTGNPLGPHHGVDNAYIFIQPDGRTKDPTIAEKFPLAWISFAYYHDPTTLTGLDWQVYTKNSSILQFKGDDIRMIPDTFRKEAMQALINNKAAKVFGF
ncbi:alpha/beta-hydrolase [Testicularia cyperi]|uniref:Carboxylic ester hydrolase n=1 Tax=Testicularia cyperi TaxID=1882483 RepID=A0A317XXM3_9BASI|nr:alpha/beta-hydrolase [Testicularia cyperi]